MDSVLVCGVDEAGRGPLAGPVYAAAVILDKKRRINGLADSKVLAPERRDVLAGRIKERAIAWAVAHATVEEIDRINIFHASMLAMRRAVQALGVRPEEAWIDGPHSPGLSCRTRTIVDGDALHPVISAASILAKTERDAGMCGLLTRHPRRAPPRHLGGVDPRETRARRRDVRPLHALPALRLRPPQGLRHRGAPRRPGPPRTLRDPPAQLLCRRGVFPEGSLRRQLGRPR